ncbi:DEAD/DEAH box helicase [Candidatus Thorarchaeota archaeon]|nr:MAG: DEAD/DEAH box helicase [Candidatus Thorarchaeota archaeon]
MIKDKKGKNKEKSEPDNVPQHLFDASLPAIIGSSPAKASSLDCWRAQSFATRLHREFEMSLEKGFTAGMRSRYYALFECYEETTRSLREAIQTQNTAMMVSSLRSLIALNAPLSYMHRMAPRSIPLHLTLDPVLKKKLIGDLIIKSLQDATEPLDVDEICDYINSHEMLQQIREETVQKHLKSLLDTDHISEEKGLYSRTNRTYKTTNLDDATLKALLGKELYEEFERNGFPGISNILNKKEKFYKFFERTTGSGKLVSELFISALSDIQALEEEKPKVMTWQHTDLIGSAIPRPYQRDAYAIFRGHGYQGPLIEAPTASGKTLVGMMAIQDWLDSLSPGESILVLVPTVNYEQQWVRELCYKDIGLHLSPDDVFAGTTAAYEEKREQSKTPPAVLVMTYTALAQLGSPKGKGGFDKISIERFLQGSSTRYIILDEVHKVVQDMDGVSAGVARLLVDWLEDGSLEGLIGFSGTAEAYRNRFDELGLKLVYVMPSVDLIAYGFVAPYGEFGVPFTYSEREKRIRTLLAEYKELMQNFIHLVGSEFLRAAFRLIPYKERLRISMDFLDMYSYRKDRRTALRNRFRKWSRGKDLNINEMPLVSIIQIAENLSDAELLSRATAASSPDVVKKKKKQFQKILLQVNDIRSSLIELVKLTYITSRLDQSKFGLRLPAKKLMDAYPNIETKVALDNLVKDTLAYSIVGLYTILRSLYYRMGEGRVKIISSIIDAEQSVRNLTGVIIFGKGKQLDWETGKAEPGYSGVAGIFAQMLLESELIPMAVLSNEMYLPWLPDYSVPNLVSDFIKKEIMGSELAKTLLSLLVQGVQVSPEQRRHLSKGYEEILDGYLNELGTVGALRPVEFDELVLQKLRELVGRLDIQDEETILSRLNLEYPHMDKWMRNFFDYALVASRFEEAEMAELRHPTGKTGKFFVVRMAQDERKQLMYDLAARILDSDILPINLIVVSRWARTGWNVISPNLLIDATATRNVTAWQQLRGRSMRALPSWDDDCYEAMMLLLGSRKAKHAAMGSKSNEPQSTPEISNQLDAEIIEILLTVHHQATSSRTSECSDELPQKIRKGDLSALTANERQQLAAELMLARNKVTHIYELVKAYGGTNQIRYNRRHDEWRRTLAIATKHSHNYSINPFTGDYEKGEEHAPLIYIDDPRDDSPARLQTYLTSQLKQCDFTIVDGWIRALLAKSR